MTQIAAVGATAYMLYRTYQLYISKKENLALHSTDRIKKPDRWRKRWEEINTTDKLFWKDGDENFQGYLIDYNYLQQLGVINPGQSIFIPLSGDCKFASHAFSKPRNHILGINEFVDIAVSNMKSTLGGEFIQQPLSPEGILWKNHQNTISIWECNFFQVSVSAQYDLIFDKDAFGAIPPDQRKLYVKKISEILKPGGHVFLSVKDKASRDLKSGPPFHIDEKIVSQYWISQKYVLLDQKSSCYEISNPLWKQRGFVLKYQPE